MMTEPDFFAVVHRQRACRAFSDAAVSDDLVARVLDAATFAPERGEPPAVGVRGRARPGAARPDRRPHGAGLGSARARALGDRLDAEVFADVDQGATGTISAAPVLVVVARRHRPLACPAPCRRPSIPRSRTCCSPRARSGSAPRSRRSRPCSPTSCATPSVCPSPSSRSRWSRSASPPGRSARRGASRSPPTPTATATASPWTTRVQPGSAPPTG